MVSLKVFEAAYCDIFYDDDEKVLYAKWNGFLKPDEVRAGCQAMTKFIEKNKIKYHVSDHTNLKVLSKEVQDYLTKQWFSEVESIGLEKIAALVSANAFAKATVDKVNTEAQIGTMKICTFARQQDCLNWFKEN